MAFIGVGAGVVIVMFVVLIIIGVVLGQNKDDDDNKVTLAEIPIIDEGTSFDEIQEQTIVDPVVPVTPIVDPGPKYFIRGEPHSSSIAVGLEM